MGLLGHLWPRRIAGQMTLLLAVSAAIFNLCLGGAFLLARFGRDEPPKLRSTRLAFAVNLLAAAPAGARPALLAALAQTGPELAVETDPASEPPLSGGGAFARDVAAQLKTGIAIGWAGGSGSAPHLVFRLPDGSALRAAVPKDVFLDIRSEAKIMATASFMALSTTLFVLWAVRSVTKPLRGLAEASDAFVLQSDPAPLAETGPSEILSVSRAFNRMQSRVTGMVADRTRMLTAVSHDLRTPITRMRLRTEFIEDPPLRVAMQRDLGQMDALVNGALSFVRNRTTAKPAEPLDIAVLLRTVCDEFADMGQRVAFRGPDHLVIQGHSDELQRAFTNLVENASHYGESATVELKEPCGGSVDVFVSDDGPGIPIEHLDTVMQPFQRGPVRSKEKDRTGFGLGLPIVAAIATAHGGELTLANLKPHGLQCRICIPVG